jgi:hypothetical protein
LKLTIANAVSFQLVWIAAVAGAANGIWWSGPLAALLFAAWQLPLSPCPRADLKLMAAAAALGFAIDSLLVYFDLLVFQSPVPWPQAAPIWIVSMWIAFALTLNHSLSSLKRHPLLAVALGLLGGPLAYWVAATAWNAVDLNGSVLLPLLVIGIVWALVTPMLLGLAERFRLPAQES